MIGKEGSIAFLRKGVKEADSPGKEFNDLKGKLNDLEQGFVRALTAIETLLGKSNMNAYTMEHTLAETDCLRNKCEEIETQKNELEEMKKQSEKNSLCKLRKTQCLEQEFTHTRKKEDKEKNKRKYEEKGKKKDKANEDKYQEQHKEKEKRKEKDKDMGEGKYKRNDVKNMDKEKDKDKKNQKEKGE